jgi:DNA mismatch repair protein MutS2
MDERTLRVLEFAKIRDRLAGFTSFSVGEERARALLPTDDIREAREWQAETREARRLLDEKTDVHLGGVHDLRPFLEQAIRGGALVPGDLLDIRGTLQRARSLQRTLTRIAETFPHVGDVAARIAIPAGVIEEIGRCIDERGEVLDSASEALERIRRQLREAHSHLLDRLQRIVTATGNQPYLQEPIVTQRGGRYVIPLRAEFKGRIPGLVHDQSGSGATLFIEPLAVVDLNNQWREAQLAEEEEIRRILTALTAVVGAESGPIQRTVEALGDLDFIFAKARYAEEIDAVEPELIEFKKTEPVDARRAPRHRAPRATTDGQDDETSVSPVPSTIHHPGSTIKLIRARHPLLNPLTVVPIDIYTDEEYFVLIVTGPNTGGKTVSLKTTGLLTLMAQSGLAIPAADGSAVSVFEDVLADIGDEQSIEQSLSTFSSHMTHIVQILDRATSRSLVLLDELGAGTDPEEGAALAQALLNTLLAGSITTLATTHYSELKVFAHNAPFVENASVEFNIETLSPTYKLSIGLPGRSNAFAIARRLGLPEDVVERAEALVSPDSLEAETMLAEIKRAREAALAAEAAAQLTQRRAEVLGADLHYRLSQIEAARREVLAEARAEAQAELEAIHQDIAQVRAGLGDVAKGPTRHEAWLAEAEEVLARRAAETRTPPSTATPAPLVIDGPLQVGDRVWVRSLQASGEITNIAGNDVEIRIGSFRLKLSGDRVELRERGGQEAVQAEPSTPPAPNPGMELDLRGMTVEDTLAELDSYLDTAYRAGLPFVRIIHGKGTGALRQAVREELRSHPLVSEYRAGESNEGGEGVTVAKLVQR